MAIEVVQRGLWDVRPVADVAEVADSGYEQLPLWDKFASDAGRFLTYILLVH